MSLNVIFLFAGLFLLKWEQSSGLSCFTCVSYKSQENTLCMDPLNRAKPPNSKNCRTGEKCVKILGTDKNNVYQVVRDCQQTVKSVQTDSYAITGYVFGDNRFNGKLWVCNDKDLCNGSGQGAGTAASGPSSSGTSTNKETTVKKDDGSRREAGIPLSGPSSSGPSSSGTFSSGTSADKETTAQKSSSVGMMASLIIVVVVVLSSLWSSEQWLFV